MLLGWVFLDKWFFFNSKEARNVYIRSPTHDLYSSDFIQKTQLNAALSTSHFGKCSGSLAGPEIRGNCSEVSFHILSTLKRSTPKLCGSDGGICDPERNSWMFPHCRLLSTLDKNINQTCIRKGWIRSLPKTNIGKDQCPNFFNFLLLAFLQGKFKTGTFLTSYILQIDISRCICQLCLAFQMGLDWGWELIWGFL